MRLRRGTFKRRFVTADAGGNRSSCQIVRRIVCVIAVACSCVLAVPARAQQQNEPEDPEDEKQIGLWLDQGISTGLSANKSLDVEFHERFDEGASNLFEYFVQGGVAFRLRPWFTLMPIYRYQRHARIIIMRPEITLHLEAEYTFADCSRRN